MEPSPIRQGQFRRQLAATVGLLLIAMAAALYAFLGNPPEPTVQVNPPEPVQSPPAVLPAALSEPIPTAPAPRLGPPVLTILPGGHVQIGGDTFPPAPDDLWVKRLRGLLQEIAAEQTSDDGSGTVVSIRVSEETLCRHVTAVFASLHKARVVEARVHFSPELVVRVEIDEPVSSPASIIEIPLDEPVVVHVLDRRTTEPGGQRQQFLTLAQTWRPPTLLTARELPDVLKLAIRSSRGVQPTVLLEGMPDVRWKEFASIAEICHKSGISVSLPPVRESEKGLTLEDPVLQSNLETAFPEIERVDRQTVDAAITQDNIGQPDARDTDTAAFLPPGLRPGDLATPAGIGGGFLGGRDPIPNAFYWRSGATKSKLLKEGGGNEESERAVARGLAWLARQQRQDGAWVYDSGDRGEVIAATGMALLPFLAAGETHKAGSKYQKTVLGALSFLVKNCPLSGPNAGKFNGSGSMYAQAIGTLALCEAYGMTKDKALLLAPAQAAINYVQAAQASNGSWGYASRSPGDVSIVGWQIQALQAARLSKDILVADEVIKNAIKFLDLAGGGARKATYGYADSQGASPGTALTAVGLLCRYYVSGWGQDNAGMAEGVLGLMKRSPKPATAGPDLYFYYYATQVVHHFEGEEWKTWNEGAKHNDGTRKGGMRDWLISLQMKKEGANLGSWDPDGGWIGRSCGRLGTTAMSLLILEVYYRYPHRVIRDVEDEPKKPDVRK